MATTGQKYPTAAVTAAENPWLDNDWTTPTNIYADDGATANITASTYDSPDQSYVLKARGFDFSSIPDGSVINGITCRVNAWYRSGQGTGSIDLMQLLDTSSAKVGTNQCSTPTALTTNNATIVTKGSASDKWGNALTAAWVKSANFGVALGCAATAANADVDIDYVTLEIDYTPPPEVIGAGNIASGEAHGSPVVNVVVSASAVLTGEAFGGGDLSLSAVLTGIDSQAAVGSPMVEEQTAVTVSGAGNIASAEVFGSLSATYNIEAAGISGEEAIPSPSVIVSATLSGIISTEAVGTPIVENNVSPQGIASDEQIGGPLLDIVITPDGIVTGQAFGQPVFAVNILAGGLDSMEEFGLPTLTSNDEDLILGAGGIGSAEAVGSLMLSVTVQAQGAPSLEQFGNPTISIVGEVYNISGAGGIGSGETFGVVTVGIGTMFPRVYITKYLVNQVGIVEAITGSTVTLEAKQLYSVEVQVNE